ncbi:MAG: VWA domain-containing protein [Saprospiraceae bacterium]|nr:VWA domain-containing protein [Saprospiraceae bacterium]
MLQYFENFHFSAPWWLLALAVIPILIYFYFFRIEKKEAPLIISDLKSVENIQSLKGKLYKYLPVLKVLALILLIIALARPQLTLTEETVKAEGIDIILAMDLSSSMLAKDFNPDRLEVSKLVATEFVDKRPYDRIGLVVFAGESFTQCPLTTDHNILKDFLSGLQIGMLEDGTAIGMGLATAVNRIKDSEAKSKIVILLTDGVNNAGYIKPITAAEIAAEFGIRVYTIGVGTMGQALSPVNRRMDGQYIYGLTNVEIDTELMKQISGMTGGKYFRAVDRQSLEEIYREIDKLEKTEMEISVFKRYKEMNRIFLYPAMLLWLVFIILRLSIFRTFT